VWCTRSHVRWAQNGATALHRAAFHGHLPVVEALLRVPGVDPNSKDNVRGLQHEHLRGVLGARICIVVCVRVDFPRVHLGCARLRDAQGGEQGGATALHRAADSGDLAIVDALLRAPRVDAGAKDTVRWRAIQSTRRNCCV
jgi:ankyrin repeat protein